MSDFLPQELLAQILLRVPSKSLIRFRCVSKSWKSLISSPDFVSMHTQRAFLSGTPVPRILVLHRSQVRKTQFYSVHPDNETFTIDDCVKVVFPSSRLFDYFKIAGSSNGLVLLSHGVGSYEEIILWNPSIRKTLTLPLPRATFNNVGLSYGVLGFGYDVRSNDFKVVSLAYVQGWDGEDKLPPIVEVFSLSTGNWREINCSTLQNLITVYPPNPTAFVDGKVHWIARGKSGGAVNKYLIQVFHISDEVFEEMPLPASLVRERSSQIAIAVFEESLAVLVTKPTGTGLYCYIWVMEEYGDGTSWAKMFNVHLDGERGRVLGFRKNGDVLLTTKNRNLVSYDPKTRGTTGLGDFGNIFNDNRNLSAVTYTESLALLNEGEQALVDSPNHGFDFSDDEWEEEE